MFSPNGTFNFCVWGNQKRSTRKKKRASSLPCLPQDSLGRENRVSKEKEVWHLPVSSCNSLNRADQSEQAERSIPVSSLVSCSDSLKGDYTDYTRRENHVHHLACLLQQDSKGRSEKQLWKKYASFLPSLLQQSLSGRPHRVNKEREACSSPILSSEASLYGEIWVTTAEEVC